MSFLNEEITSQATRSLNHAVNSLTSAVWMGIIPLKFSICNFSHQDIGPSYFFLYLHSFQPPTSQFHNTIYSKKTWKTMLFLNGFNCSCLFWVLYVDIDTCVSYHLVSLSVHCVGMVCCCTLNSLYIFQRVFSCLLNLFIFSFHFPSFWSFYNLQPIEVYKDVHGWSELIGWADSQSASKERTTQNPSRQEGTGKIYTKDTVSRYNTAMANTPPSF